MIPHKINELTVNMNPIKLREYLAAGLPVVATPLPEVRRYEPGVRIAQGVDGWIAALEQALKDRSAEADQRRSALVAGEDWSVRIATIVREMQKVAGAELRGSGVRGRESGVRNPKHDS